MADNPYKRDIVNTSISLLREGRTSAAGQFHGEIDDSVFNDYSTGATEDVKRICRAYPIDLKIILRDIKPGRAIQYADLGAEILINKEVSGWEYLFELPADYLDLVAQVIEGSRKFKPGRNPQDVTIDHKLFRFNDYAHTVEGTDDQSWYCTVPHTAAAANKPITGADYLNYWALYDVAKSLGAPWTTGWAYKASESGLLLATNTYSNEPSETVDGSVESAYIKYIPFVQAGINDKPQYYTEEFKMAFAVRLAADITKDEDKQFNMLRRYQLYDRTAVQRIQQKDKFVQPVVTTFEARTR